MASTKPDFSYKQEEVASSSSKNANESVSETLPSPRVVLNPADCDLDFVIESDGLVGYGLTEEGFSYCWSGARANVGITGGKYCFGCKIISQQHVVMDDVDRKKWHLCEVGVSKGDDAIASLGESKHNYSIRGKIPNDRLHLTFWTDFDVGEMIICCVDLEKKPSAFIGFFQNGISLGVTCHPDAAGLLGRLEGSGLFPHVLLKNIKVEMQFSVEDGLVPQEGYKPWSLAVADGNGIMGPILSTHPSDCEVIMMVGLPDSGKTNWAQNWVKVRPKKRYVLLGIELILDKMKVPLRINKDDDGMFNHWFDRATEILNRMLPKAATIPRNYIIDDINNVCLNTRKDTLEPFADFHKIAVVVFPELTELFIRAAKKYIEIGRSIPNGDLNNMIGKFVLPKTKDMPDTNEFFDQIMFVEQNQDESQKCLDEMKLAFASDTNNEDVTKLKNLEL